MVTKFNVQTGEIFKVENRNDYRFGRTYTVVGFDADKFGNLYAVADWNEEQGTKSSHIFFSRRFCIKSFGRSESKAKGDQKERLK